MHRPYRVTVNATLIAGFLLLATLGALIGLQGIRKAGDINDLATLMYERELLGLRHTAEANAQIIAAGRAIRSAILAGSEAERRIALHDARARLERADSGLEQSAGKFVTEDGKAKLAAAHAALRAYSAGIRDIAAMLEADAAGAPAAMGKLAEFRTYAEQAEELMAALVAQKQGNADRLNAETDRIYAHIVFQLSALTVGGAVAGILVGVLISRNLTRQLGGEPRDVARIADAIAAGDLSGRIDATKAPPGSIVHAMRAMQLSQRRTVGTVRANSEGIATGASQIAAASSDLSLRTVEQAGSLEETAAALQQLTAAVKHNADHARQANAMAAGASEVALKGGHVVAQVVGTMSSINDAARKIADVTGLIDGIAFQPTCWR